MHIKKSFFNKIFSLDRNFFEKKYNFLGLTLLKIEKGTTTKKYKVFNQTLLKIEKGATTKKYKVFNQTLFKREKNATTKKYKLFNQTLFKVEKSATTKKYKVFNQTLFKIKYANSIIYRILNIPVWKRRNTTATKVSHYTTKDLPPKIIFAKTAQPLVSIIIPIYSQIDYIMLCLYSISQAKNATSFEIIISSNSQDTTPKLTSFARNVTIVRNEENQGYINKCNNAAKHAQGKYLYFMNGDTQVHENWLDELVHIFSLQENVGVVGSKIFNSEHHLQENGGYIYSNYIANGIAGDFLRQCSYVPIASFMTPKSLFDQIGGFETTLSSEDINYCLEAKKLGYTTYVQPNSKITHYGFVSNNDKNELIANNRILFQKKHASFLQSRVKFDNRLLPHTGDTRPAKILVVDDLIPQFDRHAGGKTIFQFLEAFLKMGLEVKFSRLHEHEADAKYYPILCKMGIEIIPFNSVCNYIEEHLGLVDYLFISRPETAKQFMIKGIKAKGIKVIYYGHDIHHLRLQREFDLNQSTSQQEVDKICKLERSIISLVDIAYYPSLVEVNYLKNNFTFMNVKKIPPYLYTTHMLPKQRKFSASSGILFVGSTHAPNLDALMWFIKEVFPIIVQNTPNIVLSIVGSSIQQDIFALESDNIKVLGFLSDEELADAFSQTRVSIAPIRYGSGIKGKIINSLYYKTPVVTTTIGAEGIDIQSPIVSIADSAEDFAHKVLELYTNKTLWESLDVDYVKAIADSYTYERAISIFAEDIDASPRKNALLFDK